MLDWKDWETVIRDPYVFLHNDTPEDSDLWLSLLAKAHESNFELFAILDYLRGTGVKLVKSPKHNYRLEPIIGEDAWISLEQYQKEKQYLLPYTDELARLLKEL